MDESKDKKEAPVYVKHKYSEEFIKWAQTPISEEEFHNLAWGISTPKKTYSQILAENPISEEETRQNEEELLRLFNSLPMSGEDEMCEKKNANGVPNE